MKKMLLCLLAVILAVCVPACTRYNPIEMTADPEKTGSEDGQTAAAGDPAAETAAERPSVIVEEEVLQIVDDQEEMILRGDPVKVKGVYLSAHAAGTPEIMDRVIEQIDATELNAVVIDFKTDEGFISAQIDSPVFEEVDSCRNLIPDLDGLMKKLKEHHIYAIARVVAFRDPYLAEQKPEWSLKTADGSLYRDKKGLAWVNPYKQEVWDYLIEAGTQAAKAGFDEVQFDYIRFATDSTMRTVVFDEADTGGRSKTDIVTEFTEYAADALSRKGVYVAADVFGAIIGSTADAEAVGQIYGDMAEHVDYICPMIYPSHYGDGNFGLDHPDLHPYETVLGALGKSSEELALHGENVKATVRPWLQDFTASYLEHYQKYGDEQLRQQIQAVYDAGYEEWILWNAAGKYHYGGLLNE